MKKVLLIITGLLFFSHAQAQEEEQEQEQKEITITMPRLRLGIEAGIDGFFGDRHKPSMLRENQSSSSYYDDHDYYCGFVPDRQSYYVVYIGIKPEYSISKRFAAAMGARFSFSEAALDSDKDYFLWRVNETETNTDYVKINKILQRNYYVGIPMEIKFFPREKDYPVRHYFVLGTVLNFLAASDNNVSFQSSAMKKFASTVSDQIGNPDSFHGNVYAVFGLKIGDTHRPFGNIEFHFPLFIFASKNPNSFTKGNGTTGIGFQTTLQIPIFPKHQLVYKVND